MINEKYEILIYFSDQHSPQVAGYMGDPFVCTPNLDRIAARGMSFDNAYTACPLCVPARAAFMTGRIPSKLNVFNNNSDFKSSDLSFAHMLALNGYETNLIGRMHFIGLDHYHGFTRRLGTDLTSSYWGTPTDKRADAGEFGRSFYQKFCLEVIGAGDSPVLEYDRSIVDEAVEFYSKDNDKAQMTVVGTYGPHFPYVCHPELVDKYKNILRGHCNDARETFDIPILNTKVQWADDEDLLSLRAAYYAMVELMDEQIGRVYEAFRASLRRSGRKGVFIYMSDHGDQIGYKGLYGKQTFFERSAAIPLLVEIDGFEGGRRIEESCSIMDIGPTLIELSGSEPLPYADGRSFLNLLRGEREPGRSAVAEFYDRMDGKTIVGRMLHRDGMKLISYQGYEDKDMLFDLASDPEETRNVAKDYKSCYNELKEILRSHTVSEDKSAEYEAAFATHAVLERIGLMQTGWNCFTHAIPDGLNVVPEEWKRARR